MIYLDDAFFDHPKVIAAGGEATLVYLHGLAWLKQQRSTDGRIPKGVLPRLSPVIKGRHVNAEPLAARLVEVVLWHDDQSYWTCHDYVVKNAKSIGKSQQSSAAAHARWAKEGKRPQSERTSERNADASTSALQQSTVHSPQSTVPIPSPKSRGSHQVAGHNGHGTPGPAEAGNPWGDPEPTGPNETPDQLLQRRGMAIRLRDVVELGAGQPPNLLACNQAVAEALQLADHRVVDEQIGWLAQADNPPRTPTVLVAAVRRITTR